MQKVDGVFLARRRFEIRDRIALGIQVDSIARVVFAALRQVESRDRIALDIGNASKSNPLALRALSAIPLASAKRASIAPRPPT